MDSSEIRLLHCGCLSDVESVHYCPRPPKVHRDVEKIWKNERHDIQRVCNIRRRKR